jgi:ADP-heptose:LPS heptosyltransferase
MAILNWFYTRFKFMLIRKIAPLMSRLIYIGKPVNRNTLLVIKCDGIGDYLLFRNYLGAIRNSEKYKGWKVYLLTTKACRDFVREIDMDYIDGCFWYGDDFFLKWELVALIFRLNKIRPETVFYPNFSRKFSVDWLVRNIKALNKIGVDGDTVNEPLKIKRRMDRYYTMLIPATKVQLHEFERNREIVEYFTGAASHIRCPFIETTRTNHNGGNIVVFCGGSSPARRWDAGHFQALCNGLAREKDTVVILSGGKDAVSEANAIAAGIKIVDHNFTNNTGETSLIQLYDMIMHARLLITGDTVALHIAACVHTPTICLSRGDHYGRFVPYPEGMFNELEVLLPPGFAPGTDYYDRVSDADINQITPEQVLSTAKAALIKYSDDTPRYNQISSRY